MKKIIALSLLALMVGATIPSTVKADGIVGKVSSVAAYPFKKTWGTIKHSANAIKHVAIATKYGALATLELTKGTLALSVIAVSCVALACGVDYALAWATELGLPATIFNTYTFGTLYKGVYAFVAPIVATSPEFFASLPEKITSLPELVKNVPEILKSYYHTFQIGQAAQKSFIWNYLCWL